MSKGVFQRFARRVRIRLLCIFISYGVGASSTWYFRGAIFHLLFAPAGNLSPFGGLPVFTGPTDMMGATIHLAMIGGLVTAAPVTVVCVYSLVRPLLNHRQRRFVTLAIPAVAGSYLIGAAFAYFVMLPIGLRFLLNFSDGIAVPLITITAYMSIAVAMLFWLGVVFELPLVMFMLTRMGLVRYEQFQRVHKYVPAAAFILGALITPSFDVLNQTLISVPIILLFEAGLCLSRLARPKGAGHRPLRQRIKDAASLICWRIESFWL